MHLFIPTLRIEVLIFTVILTFLLYRLLTKNFNYWKDRNVPFVPPTALFGNVRDLILYHTNYGEEYQKLYNAGEGYPYFGVFQSAKPCLILRDPELIKRILVKDFAIFPNRITSSNEKTNPLAGNLFALDGKRWRILRSKLTPAFSSARIKVMFHTVLECAQDLRRVIDENIDNGVKVMDMKALSAKFSMDTIGSCAFGLQLKTLNNKDSEFNTMGKKMSQPSRKRIMLRFLIQAFPGLEKWIKVNIISPEVANFIVRLVKNTVDYRSSHNITRNDFLQLLIELREKGSIGSGTNEESPSDSPINSKLELTDDLMAAQCYSFLLAGFESSSTTMSCCLLELANKPKIQDRLYKDINNAITEYNGEFSYEAIMRMPYLDKVVSETLRLHPTVGCLDRECKDTYKLPECDLCIEKGLKVIIPVYGLHQDPKYFPDPTIFEPERFSEEEIKKRPHYVYLPFGEGPRNCIGMRFGLMQTKLGLAYLLHNYEFHMTKETEYPPSSKPGILLVIPASGIKLQVSRRGK